MTPTRRWLCVAIGVALVIGIPLLALTRPTSDSGTGASALLARVQSSHNVPYSGYVESLGTLSLPVTDRFTDISDLFGQRTRMRVWWRSADEWRVDNLSPTGESDLVRDPSGLTTWEYEKARVTRMTEPDIRLPRASDLLPPVLARRLLRDADPADVTRLDATRVAGRDADGLRLDPSQRRTSIDHVDVWADQSTGLPLRVTLFAIGDKTASLTSTFMDVSSQRPSADMTAWSAPPGAEFRYDDVIDIADAANRFADVSPPPTLAGLERSSDRTLRAVGSYGSGVTQLLAIPLWDDAAEPLREQLDRSPGREVLGPGLLLRIGPLSVILTDDADTGAGWLVAGTVTQRTLVQAAREVVSYSRGQP